MTFVGGKYSLNKSLATFIGLIDTITSSNNKKNYAKYIISLINCLTSINWQHSLLNDMKI